METLIEYEWPPESLEKWFIMEHVGNFLSIKSFNRKHRELNVRTLSPEEKDDLLAHNIISQIESTLNLQAVKSDELLDLMAKKYPHKFYRYCLIQSLVGNNTNTSENIIMSDKNKDKEKPYFVTQDGYIFDKKCYQIHQLLPSRIYSTDPLVTQNSQMEPENSFDRFIKLKNNLKQLCDSIVIPDYIPIDSNGSHNYPYVDNTMNFNVNNTNKCNICTNEILIGRKLKKLTHIACSKCKLLFHLKCLGISFRSVDVIKRYKWKCVDCKICEKCCKPVGDMIFCDHCDRSYHPACVGLNEIPIGRWICNHCGICSSCLKRRPGSTGWFYETLQVDGDIKNIQVHCLHCSRLFKAGKFCHVCLEVFYTDSTDKNQVTNQVKNEVKNEVLVNCSRCKQKVHKECYDRLSKACLVCLGEVKHNISIRVILDKTN